MRDYFNKKTTKMYLYCKKEKTAVCEWLTAGVSSGTKKDAELIGPLIKHKNNAEPKNKLGPASCCLRGLKKMPYFFAVGYEPTPKLFYRIALVSLGRC